MHLSPVVISATVVCAVASCASAEPVLVRGRLPLEDSYAALVRDVNRRALPNSPSGGYAPAVVPCPANKPTIRSASSLSPSEVDWLKLRRKATVDPMIDFLKRAGIPNFDAERYIRAAANNISVLPNIAIAASGGGYRALMNGAGFVAAADSRTAGSAGKGGIGGLLQSSTYLYAASVFSDLELG